MTEPSTFSNLRYLGASSNYLARAFLNSHTVVLLYIYKFKLPFLFVALFLTTTLSNSSPFNTALCGYTPPVPFFSASYKICLMISIILFDLNSSEGSVCLNKVKHLSIKSSYILILYSYKS
jgi:hypothetical protein